MEGKNAPLSIQLDLKTPFIDQKLDGMPWRRVPDFPPGLPGIENLSIDFEHRLAAAVAGEEIHQPDRNPELGPAWAAMSLGDPDRGPHGLIPGDGFPGSQEIGTK